MKYIVSYPRSGSTYLRFLIANYLQDDPVTFDNIDDLIPDTKGGPLGWRKSHTPPKKFFRKVPWEGVLLLRDPKGVAISYYNYQLKYGKTTLPFETWLERWVLKGDRKWGRWDEAVLEAREKHTGPEIWYRFLTKYPQNVLFQLDGGVNPLLCIKAVRNSSFRNMQRLEQQAKRQMGNEIPFVRKGSDREWQEVLTQDQIDFIDTNLYHGIQGMGN